MLLIYCKYCKYTYNTCDEVTYNIFERSNVPIFEYIYIHMYLFTTFILFLRPTLLFLSALLLFLSKRHVACGKNY